MDVRRGSGNVWVMNTATGPPTVVYPASACAIPDPEKQQEFPADSFFLISDAEPVVIG